MFRLCFSLFVTLAFTSLAPAADAKPLTIRWHGQSFFEVVSTKGTRIVLDPHAIPNYGRKVVQADLILTTHPHSDHQRVEVVENAQKATRLDGVLGPLTKAKWNTFKDEKFKDTTINLVGTYHDDSEGLKFGLNSALVIEVDGLRIVHLGDLGHVLTENQIKKIGKVDILMVPVGGVYTINGSEARKVVEQLKPTRLVLPMHYGTDVYDDLLAPTEFLDGLKNVEKKKTNELTIDPAAKAGELSYVVLHWSSEK